VGYTRTLAGWLGMDPAEVGRAVTAVVRRPPQQQQHPDSGEETPRRSSLAELPSDLTTRLERDALMAVLQQPGMVGEPLVRRAVAAAFTTPSLAVVRDGIAGSIDHLSSADWLDRVIEEVPVPFAGLVKELGVAPIPARDEKALAAYCIGVVTGLIDRDLSRSKAELLGRLQRTDAREDAERFRDLQQQLARIEQERRALRDD